MASERLRASGACERHGRGCWRAGRPPFCAEAEYPEAQRGLRQASREGTDEHGAARKAGRVEQARTSRIVEAREGLLEVAVEADGISCMALLTSLGMSRASASATLARGLVSRSVSRDVSAGTLGGTRTGEALGPSDVVSSGQAIRIRLEPSHGPGPCAKEAAEVVWEDPFALAANKPAGILVHPDGATDPTHTIAAQVQAHLAREGSCAVAQAVQRLDVPTTGIVLFSKTEQFQPTFDALVAGHAMGKHYLAIVRGALPAGTRLRFDGPIGRDRHDARRMRVSPTGKQALTVARVLGSSGQTSLVLVGLATGRRHQIRVHLAHAGHPIVGDELYGGIARGGSAGSSQGPSRAGSGGIAASGLMLHAWHEAFDHPVTGERVELWAPWPERFGLLGYPESRHSSVARDILAAGM